MLKLCLLMAAILDGGRGHNFESILPKDHPCHVCFKLARTYLCQVSDTGSPEPLVLLIYIYYSAF
jgi:hypothetical protein